MSSENQPRIASQGLRAPRAKRVQEEDDEIALRGTLLEAFLSRILYPHSAQCVPMRNKQSGEDDAEEETTQFTCHEWSDSTANTLENTFVEYRRTTNECSFRLRLVPQHDNPSR